MRDWSSERMEERRWVVAGSESGIVGLGDVWWWLWRDGGAREL